MTTNNEQNGRQPPFNRPPPPLDPRAGNVLEQRPLCRKYVWGTCTKGIHCRFRHDLDIDEMKKILKFCHDFQNRRDDESIITTNDEGCGRVDCTYLHASKEEETLFRNENRIPRILLERYAALAQASNSMQNFEGVPQMMMFVTAPPPPPPPPAQMMPTATAPPPPPPPQPAPVFPPIQQPPPPPPPPPPTVPSTSVVQSASVFTGPPPQGAAVTFPMSQPPPPLPAMFDASRPPPPIPVQTNKNGAVKRRMEGEAGPSKIRKAEGPGENSCENCVQQSLRIDVSKQKLDKLHCELKYKTLVYKKNLKEYDNAMEIMRGLVSSDLFHILEEYVEGGPPQMQDILSQLNANPTVSLLEYVVNNQRNVDSGGPPQMQDILSQLSANPTMSLLEYVVNNQRNVDSSLSPSLRLDDTMSSWASLSRVMNPNPISHPSPDRLQTLLDILDTNTERETRTEPDRTSTLATTSMNGFKSSAVTRTYSSASVAGPSGMSSSMAGPSGMSSSMAGPSGMSSSMAGPSGMSSSMAGPSGMSSSMAGPSGMSSSMALGSAAPVTATPAPAYPSFNPGFPPPTNRPYYCQSYGCGPATSSTSIPPQYNSPRVRPPQMIARPPQMIVRPPQVTARPPQVTARPPGHSAAPSMPPNYNQDMMGRYPHQQYYRYQ